MALVTAASFIARLWLLYQLGYLLLVELWMSKYCTLHGRVALAVVVPPLVDGIQSMALIMVGSHARPLLSDIILPLHRDTRQIREMLAKQQEQLTTIEFIIKDKLADRNDAINRPVDKHMNGEDPDLV